MLTINNVSKTFEQSSASVPILNDISLTVDEGEIVCLLGPSGCGKTTLLRIIAGLEEADRGRITCQGEDVAGMPVYQRRFGFMFQDFALFPHKTVEQNIAFGLRMNGWTQADIQGRVSVMLQLVNMAGYGERSPLSLSGGEQQRVALARSLASNPRLLMLDEPLGSLDRSLREALMTELRTILKSVGVTAIYVTHDQEEAYAVADRLVIMDRGQIMQEGTPLAVYNQPANAFVARFLGFTNLMPGEVHPTDLNHVQTALGRWPLPHVAEAGPSTCLVRPTGAKLLAEAEKAEAAEGNRGESGGFILTGILANVSFRGTVCQLAIQITTESGFEQKLQFDLPTEVVSQVELAEVGEVISLAVDARQVVLIGG